MREFYHRHNCNSACSFVKFKRIHKSKEGKQLDLYLILSVLEFINYDINI